LRLEFRPAADGAGPLAVRLGLAPAADDDTLLAGAEAAAVAADVAVVVVGSAELTESEGFDRDTLSLPGRQDELIARVAAVNPRTVVVVNAGMPVLMPWADQVAAIIYAWLPGQAFGTALADVLTGAAEPGGRLPVSLPVRAADCPVARAIPDERGVLAYAEGLLIGYRGYDKAGLAPRYPFGHGLGYTTWDYESIDGPAQVAEGAAVEVMVTVRNTGQRPGKDVIQVYLAEPAQQVGPGRPVRVLAAFTAVQARPGQRVQARVRIPGRAFARYSQDLARWIWPGGRYTIQAGPSSRDLPLTTHVISRPGQCDG
jgi:beta-glucosidase